MTEQLVSADIQLIQRILPHRYPFLLVDKVVDIDGTSSALGIKNVTMNEPHFQGHFPAHRLCQASQSSKQWHKRRPLWSGLHWVWRIKIF